MSTQTTYTITHDLIGDSAPATAYQIAQIVHDWNNSDWTYHVNESDNELRVYAVRNADSDTVGAPDHHVHWHETTSDNEFYIIVGEVNEQTPDAPLTAAQIAFLRPLTTAPQSDLEVFVTADVFEAGEAANLVARGLILADVSGDGWLVYVTLDALELLALADATDEALPFDGPIEDTDYPAPTIDPRDARIAELEAQVKALQAQIIDLRANNTIIPKHVPDASRYTGVIIKNNGIRTDVKRDTDGKIFMVNRHESGRISLGNRIEFSIGRNGDGQDGSAIKIVSLEAK